jgi:transposase-like protein
MAVDRLKTCDDIVALAEELGVPRRVLYNWRDQLDPVDTSDEVPPENPRESTLRKEVSPGPGGHPEIVGQMTVEVAATA